MYEAYFGLRERPFDLTPNPRYLLMTSSHRGLAGLGLILSLGVAGSMLAALVLLPIGLKAWSERGVRKQAKTDAHPSVAA